MAAPGRAASTAAYFVPHIGDGLIRRCAPLVLFCLLASGALVATVVTPSRADPRRRAVMEPVVLRDGMPVPLWERSVTRIGLSPGSLTAWAVTEPETLHGGAHARSHAPVAQASVETGSSGSVTATSHGLYRGRTARYYAMWGRHRTRQLQAALARITHLKWQLRQRHASVPARTLAQSHGYSVWDRLADCESGGNWADTAGSFEGGLQFLNSTWLAHGGGAYAAHAYSASREQQIVIAERVLADQGWSAWPACSAKLGLR